MKKNHILEEQAMLKQNTLLFLFLFAFSFSSKSQAPYHLIYDKNQTSLMGAEIIITGNFLFYNFEEKYLPPQLFKEKKWTGKALNISYRLSKSLLLDLPWHQFIRVFQHEVFGHGARAREQEYTETRYSVRFPYGGGLTYYGSRNRNRFYTSSERLLRAIGGVESTMVLSNSIRNKWLRSGKLQLSEAFLYGSSFINGARYIRNTSEDESSFVNDIHNFQFHINETLILPANRPYADLNYFKKRAILNYLNPLRYFAYYALIRGYIWEGKSEVELPMIPIGNMKYLPMFRMGLSPFGTEIFIENFLKTENSLNEVYVRLGDNLYGEHWGIGLSKSNIIDNNWMSLDAQFHLWKQPETLIGGEDLIFKSEAIGAAAKVALSIKLFKETNPSNFYMNFTHKSRGFLEGELFDKGWNIRAGVTIIRND